MTSFICRPCIQRLLSSDQAVRLSILTRSLSTSSTFRKHGGLPIFLPTRSAPLNELLSQVRKILFLPAHLLVAQQDIVYKKKNHHLLSGDEPATVKLGDETHILEPINRVRDEPNTRKTTTAMLSHMNEIADFRNLMPYLSGMTTCGRSIPRNHLEKAVRLACQTNNQGAILDSLRNVTQTRLGLWDLSTARESLFGAIQIGIKGDWTADSAGDAARYAENVWELLFDQRHAPVPTNKLLPDSQRKDPTSLVDARSRADIVAVMMLVHAANKDEVMTRRYAQLFLSVYPTSMQRDIATLTADTDTTTLKGATVNTQLHQWAHVPAAMSRACEVLGSEDEVSKSLAQVQTAEMEPVLEMLVRSLQREDVSWRERRGWKSYITLNPSAERHGQDESQQGSIHTEESRLS